MRWLDDKYLRASGAGHLELRLILARREMEPSRRQPNIGSCIDRGVGWNEPVSREFTPRRIVLQREPLDELNRSNQSAAQRSSDGDLVRPHKWTVHAFPWIDGQSRGALYLHGH